MSTHPRPSPATLSDLDALPEDIIGEIIDGILYTRNRPNPSHQYAAAGIVSDLVPPFGRGQGSGGWWILSEPALAQAWLAALRARRRGLAPRAHSRDASWRDFHRARLELRDPLAGDPAP
jgi:hypothetical protein